jgi:hypothetical protein
MKTTVEIDDGLLMQAKQYAAEMRAPLRALIEAGLRQQLQQGQRPVQKTSPRHPIRWVVVPGGLPAGAAVKDREGLYAWLNTPA